LDLHERTDAMGFVAIHRHLDGHRDTPVIVMSAVAEDEVLLRPLNAAGWMQKPVSANDVQEVLGALPAQSR
jgi:CheY-like chemotaxis protein